MYRWFTVFLHGWREDRLKALEDTGALHEWVHPPIGDAVVAVALAGVVLFVMLRVQDQASLLEEYGYFWWVLFVGPAVELVGEKPAHGNTEEEADPEQLVSWIEYQASGEQWHAGNTGISIGL